MSDQNNEVDVNVLIKLYNQKLSSLTNQVILLEAKLQTLTRDFIDEKNQLLEENLRLSEKCKSLTSSTQAKPK